MLTPGISAACSNGGPCAPSDEACEMGRDGQCLHERDEAALEENGNTANDYTAYAVNPWVVMFYGYPPTDTNRPGYNDGNEFVQPRFDDLSVMINGQPITLTLYFMDTQNGLAVYITNTPITPDSVAPFEAVDYFNKVVWPEILADHGVQNILKKLRKISPPVAPVEQGRIAPHFLQEVRRFFYITDKKISPALPRYEEIRTFFQQNPDVE
jgi:hypothetical protein